MANQSNVSPAELGLYGPFGDFSNDGTGDGSFFQYNDDGGGYGVATPDSLVSADFNGDGYGDVALVDSTGLVSVFLDDFPPGGPATGFDLPPQSQISVGAGASSYLLALGNFTTSSQTQPDLVVADGSGKVTVLSNTGGGNFTRSTPGASLCQLLLRGIRRFKWGRHSRRCRCRCQHRIGMGLARDRQRRSCDTSKRSHGPE